MLKNTKLISMFLIAIMSFQLYGISTVAASVSLYTIVSNQKTIPSLTDAGLVMEAEDATICSPYVFVSNKDASGKKGIKSTSQNTKTPPSGTQGHVEFRFNCEKSGMYSVWIRSLATASNQDSVYAAMNLLNYEFMEFTVSNDFVWGKCLAAELTEGEECVFRIYTREANAIIDNILITDKRFTPTGMTGNIPQTNANPSISADYDAPPIVPPDEHPRVLFRTNDIERIKANMEKPQNKVAKNRLEGEISTPTTGEINNTFDFRLLAKIEAFAFDYAIRGNLQSGEMAVNAILNYLDGCSVENSGNATRNGGQVIYVSSKVYDWCYDLLSNNQKSKIIVGCETLADKMEIGWPPTKQASVGSHGSEAQLLRDMLAFAIATYNERPDIWEVVAGRFYQEYVPARKLLNVGHYSSQGDSYGLYRHIWDSWSHFLIKGMGADDPYITDDLYQVAYNAIYMRRPDGQLLRDGDTASDTVHKMWEYWSDRSTAYMFDAAIGNDPYLKNEFARQTRDMAFNYEGSAIMYLVFNNPDLENKSIYNLPLSRYFPDPAGISVARTGWEDGVDSPAVVAEMKAGGLVINGHQHLDAGHFQIYYKGILASDSGVYQGLRNDNSKGGTTYGSDHFNMYMTKTVAHNTMLVFDPSEPMVNSTDRFNINDGGQRAINNAGEPGNIQAVLSSNAQAATVEGQETDPTNPYEPSYTYLKGNITNAYTDKVKDFKRSFMFLNLFNDEVPAAMIVFDKVTSSNASFKKTWLLHGLEEPTINGNRTIFARTYADAEAHNAYNGKMTVDTLLPMQDNAVITKVGGEDGWSNVNGVDYPGEPSNTKVDEGSTWRIEVSPQANAATDYFLNVLQVSDNDKSYYISPTLIDTTSLYGVQISDRVATFSKSGSKISGTTSFSVSGSGQIKYTLCDMAKGTWNVQTPDGTKSVVASNDGGVLSFTAGAGTITATYVGDTGTAAVYNPTKTTENYYATRVDGRFVYNKVAPKVENGTFVMPLSTITKYFGLTQTRNGNNITVSNGPLTASLTVGSKNITTSDSNVGNAVTDVAVTEENGEIMLQADRLVRIFGGNMNLDVLSNTAYISTPSAQASDNLSLTYSTDGGISYTKIPNFKLNVTNYNVALQPNVSNILLKATAANGSFEYKVIDTYDITKNGPGAFGNKPLSSGSAAQYALKRSADNGRIPIKNETGKGEVIYTDSDGNTANYNVAFTSSQAQLTEFTQSAAFGDGAVTYISGGAVCNDNGTLLDTVSDGSRIYTLANASSNLVGASMFMLPWSGMRSATSDAVTKPNCEFFSFKAEQACNVTVLLSQAAASNSVYATQWTAENSGTAATGITLESSARNKNDYTNTDYFATAYKWVCGNSTSDLYRTDSPALTGTINSGTHIKGSTKLVYAYTKHFDAGQIVTVSNPGSITTNEISAIMPVMVQWTSNEALSIMYSIDDGKTYQHIPNFDPAVTLYDDIRLPSNVFTVKLKAVMPDAGLWWTTANYFWRDGTDDFNPIVGHALLGDFYSQISDTGYGQARYYEGRTNDNIIPISLEEARGYLHYKAEGDPTATKYEFAFRSIQPRLTEYNINATVAGGPVMFMSGAAANNDNRSILDSRAAGTSTSGNSKTWALANLSSSLEGASMFVLPFTNMVKANSGAISNPTAELFNFKAGTAGKIVVLTTNDVSETSMYRTVGTQWQAGDGSGSAPNGITTFSSARNKNDYSNITYAALAYKWKSSNRSTFPATDTYNAYRLDSPGINNGNIVNDTHVKDNTKLTYSYVKSFNAGESVSVGNIGTITAAEEAKNLIAIFVIWDKDPLILINSVSASINGNSIDVIADMSSDLTEPAPNIAIFVALYNNEQHQKLIGVKRIGYSDGESNVIFDDVALTGNEEVSIFVLNRGTLKPYTKAEKHKLSDILN